MTQFSFQEKSTLGTLLATWFIGVVYFHHAWELWQAGQLHPSSMFGLAIGLTVLLVVVLVAYHILIALLAKPEDDDERDRLVAWRAGSIAGTVMVVGVIGVVLQILVGSMYDDPVAASPTLIANALMAVVFIATSIELSLTLYFYRRGL
ncbi:MAG: hypothetical protein PF630_11990 [Gammaproteobacteria bacterium]|jgi:cytochrome bd-type quinol oxidase subunit 2|nr:hypothetical protein [Gammaproteobacteria bacterium]